MVSIVSAKNREQRRGDLEREDRAKGREPSFHPRRAEWVNKETGEVIESLIYLRKMRYPKGTKFLTVFQNGWRYISTLTLKPTETKVFTLLLSEMDFGNQVALTQETISELLGVRRTHVTRAITALTEMSLIEKIYDKKGKSIVAYYLNSSLVWKGNAYQWAEHIQQRMGSNVIPLPGTTLYNPVSLIRSRNKKVRLRPNMQTEDPDMAVLRNDSKRAISENEKGILINGSFTITQNQKGLILSREEAKSLFKQLGAALE